MEINLNKKTIKWGLIGLGAVIAVTLSLLPKPHHHTTTSTPTAPAPTTTTVSTTTSTKTGNNAPKSVTTPTNIVNTTNTVKTVNKAIKTTNTTNTATKTTSSAKSVQLPQTSKSVIKLINTDQSVTKLIGSHFVTVAIKSTSVQALNGQYLGLLSQIMVTNAKNKTVPGVWLVPRKFTNNLLIVSIKSNEVSNLQQDIAKKWFLEHKN